MHNMLNFLNKIKVMTIQTHWYQRVLCFEIFDDILNIFRSRDTQKGK